MGFIENSATKEPYRVIHHPDSGRVGFIESLVITAGWLNIDLLSLFGYIQKKELQLSKTQK